MKEIMEASEFDFMSPEWSCMLWNRCFFRLLKGTVCLSIFTKCLNKIGRFFVTGSYLRRRIYKKLCDKGNKQLAWIRNLRFLNSKTRNWTHHPHCAGWIPMPIPTVQKWVAKRRFRFRFMNDETAVAIVGQVLVLRFFSSWSRIRSRKWRRNFLFPWLVKRRNF